MSFNRIYKCDNVSLLQHVQIGVLLMIGLTGQQRSSKVCRNKKKRSNIKNAASNFKSYRCFIKKLFLKLFSDARASASPAYLECMQQKTFLNWLKKPIIKIWWSNLSFNLPILWASFFRSGRHCNGISAKSLRIEVNYMAAVWPQTAPVVWGIHCSPYSYTVKSARFCRLFIHTCTAAWSLLKSL